MVDDAACEFKCEIAISFAAAASRDQDFRARAEVVGRLEGHDQFMRRCEPAVPPLPFST